ncbi:MAG: UDP-N-acetylglucosamine--N-acetylmuramyl-(pentapeptide) pyrophosphoryl-undecaprenol N-acetylglucosamine transferase [bacterium]|nr:UDP-N-acetylglucosamine--N-acetylmuramyl-(pentapeptide) pyrophosphoryl-undecaprenol N-acetylglucosamine transferase [bacterium]
MKENKFRVLMTGGGSGGHIYPLVSVITELQILASQEEVNLEIRYLGVVGPYEGLLRENGVKVQKVLSSKFRRYFSLANIIDGPKFIISFFQALWKMFWSMPDVLFTKGGPGALAVVFVARFYRIPIIVHESDTIPGMSNLITAKYARTITTSFSSTAGYFGGREVILVGNPVRRYLFGDPLTQSKAKLFLGFDSNLPLILILGGSQGAVRINDFILDNLASLLQVTQIFHQTGRANYNSVIGEGAVVGRDLRDEMKRRYKAIDYLEKDMRIALEAADLVVSRAGSGSIFEIAAFGKPSVLIPLPDWVAAGGHQEKNAREYSATGAAVVIEETNLLPNLFLEELKGLLGSPQRLKAMSEAAKGFARPDAALKLAQVIARMNRG